MSSNPFRTCDYCGSERNSLATERRLCRRAWTIFPTTRKLACPRCDAKGRADDNRLRLLLAANHELLHRRVLAEPQPAYSNPLHQQWQRIKERHPEAVLLFRQGDEYFAFGADADRIWNHCGVLLDPVTHAAMPFSKQARFPAHALDEYLPKLVRCGCRVAICDQVMGPPVPGLLCEPQASYRKPPTRAERYLANDKRMVLERLLDLQTVLLRHKALPDHAACTDAWQRSQEETRAENAFWAARDRIALELRLREAELVHDSIRCRIGGAQCVFTASSLPRLIRAYRRNTRNA